MKNWKYLNQSLLNLQQIKAEKARRNLIDFISFTYFGDYQLGWFNQELARALTQFVQDVVDGKQPRLMIFAPPRSGKSEQFSRNLPAFALGKHPHLNIIGSSYSADLANKMSRDVQRIMDSERYSLVFPEVKIPSKGVGSTDRTRTQELFEIINHTGAYRAAGVGGGITGMGADIGIIDDPVKDAEQAASETFRNKVWEWYQTTFYTRLSPNSGILLGMTRWHEDDLAGRLLKAMAKGDGDNWQIISYPAIAEQDEKHRKKGEALHSERFDLRRLNKIKKAIGERNWQALYQQKPTAKTGGFFDVSKLTIVDAIPSGVIIKRVRAWDLAATKDDGDYTAGVLMGEGADGRFYVLDVVRGQLGTHEVEQTLIATASRDSKKVKIHLPQDPGQAGKSQASYLVGKLKGYGVKTERVSGDKEIRASPFSAQMNAGNVVLLRGAWNDAFIDEYRAFPLSTNDDQVDAGSDAFNELCDFWTSVFEDI